MGGRSWQLAWALLVAFFVHMTTVAGNPCTEAAIASGQFFFSHPTDTSKYIQCKGWGNAVERQCAAGQMWDSRFATCVDNTGSSNNGQMSQSQQYRYQTQNSNPRQCPPHQKWDAYQGVCIVDTDSFVRHELKQHQKSGFPKYGYPVGRETTTTTRKPTTTTTMTTTTTTRAPTTTRRPQKPDCGPYKIWDAHTRRCIYGYPPKKPSQQPTTTTTRQTTPRTTPKPAGPCANPAVRFLPHPTVNNMYLECVHGSAVERSCGMKVWIQTLMRCMPVMNRPTHYPQRPPTAHNPCTTGSDLFHPYPKNPSKYIECVDRYRHMILRSCAANQLWSQSEQRCQDVSPSTDRPITGTTPGGGNGGSGGTGDCANTEIFYYAVPGDATKYKQCDQNGNTFIRRCGPHKVWDDLIKTCVSDGTVVTRDPSMTYGTTSRKPHSHATFYPESPQTQKPSTTTKRYTPEPNTPRPVQPTPKPHPHKYVFAGYPIKCPPGQLLNPHTLKCVVLVIRKHGSGGGHFGGYPVTNKPVTASPTTTTTTTKATSTTRRATMPTVTTQRQYGYPTGWDGQQDLGVVERALPDDRQMCAQGFYHAYTEDETRFIQCDDHGKRFLRYCGPTKVWASIITTCVDDAIARSLTASTKKPHQTQPTQPTTTRGNMGGGNMGGQKPHKYGYPTGRGQVSYDAGNAHNNHQNKARHYHKAMMPGDAMQPGDYTAYHQGGDTQTGDYSHFGYRGGFMQPGDYTDANMVDNEDKQVSVAEKDPSLSYMCEQSEVYHAYEADSARFVMCQNGDAFVMSCPQEQIWHQLIQTCDWPKNVKDNS